MFICFYLCYIFIWKKDHDCRIFELQLNLAAFHFETYWKSFEHELSIVKNILTAFVNIWNNSQRDAPFHRIAYDYSRADGLRGHLRDFPWKDIFKLSASAAASEFCVWVRVGIDVYIPHIKYQVKLHSSPWFSASCAAAIVHRNHFFRL